MAVQAQYREVFKNHLDDDQIQLLFQQQQQQQQQQQRESCLASNQQVFEMGVKDSTRHGGAGFLSEPQPERSELTCNNVVLASSSQLQQQLGGKRRSRDNYDVFEVVVPDHQYDHQFILQQQQLRYCNKMQKGQLIATESSSSGRSAAAAAPFPNSLLAAGCSPPVSDHHHQIDELISLHNEKLRSVVEETSKRHCRSLILSVEEQVVKRLVQKQRQLDKATKKNTELEEKIKQITAHNQMWFNISKNNEAIVSRLKSTLLYLLQKGTTSSSNSSRLHHQITMVEGFGESEGLLVNLTGTAADDAQSACCQVEEEEEVKMISSSSSSSSSSPSCIVCSRNEVSVLVLPCRHLCLCKECETKLDYCPICNSTKNASLQIFIS